ncbi:DUF4166 domain-containing protein [Streptomonospora arabica]
MSAAETPPLFVRALGADFQRLHPRLQHRFSAGLSTGRGCVGRGVMHRVWHGRWPVRPLLALGALRNVLLPEAGENVPFTVVNAPYRDSFGREALTFVRSFAFPQRRRRFDAHMVYSPERGCIVDYLGTHQHLATDLHAAAGPGGELLIESGRHRLREGPVDAGVPAALAGRARVRESYDDRAGCFRIAVVVDNPVLGALFGYEGWFEADYPDAAALGRCAGLRAVREEQRV